MGSIKSSTKWDCTLTNLAKFLKIERFAAKSAIKSVYNHYMILAILHSENPLGHYSNEPIRSTII